MIFFRKKAQLPTLAEALPGRDISITPGRHLLTGKSMQPPFPAGIETVMFGMGCFWGAERKFWQLDQGIYVTAAGYAGGMTPNPTYEEVCSGLTGHNEVVLVAYDPALMPLDTLLKTFWESHDPTQGMRQGNDAGTQYRSGIYATTDIQMQAAQSSKDVYQAALSARGYPEITTEIRMDVPFFYAEEYHQQYLAKNPQGYCGLGGTGVSCSVGLGAAV